MTRKLAKITYDADNLRKQATAIRGILDELASAKETLRSSLHSLKTDWQSDAATKFLETYDTAWVEQMEAYEQHFEALATALERAASEYGALANDYRAVRFG